MRVWLLFLNLNIMATKFTNKDLNRAAVEMVQRRHGYKSVATGKIDAGLLKVHVKREHIFHKDVARGEVLCTGLNAGKIARHAEQGYFVVIVSIKNKTIHGQWAHQLIKPRNRFGEDWPKYLSNMGTPKAMWPVSDMKYLGLLTLNEYESLKGISQGMREDKDQLNLNF